jgi:EAL domain-containing protein (putative c-di-GMP-specific phosphodiesterase class I)
VAFRLWGAARTDRAASEASRDRAEDQQDQEDTASAAAAEELAGRVRRILDAGEHLEVVLQPIVAMDQRAPVGYEALARFRTTPYRPPDEWFAEAWDVCMGVELELAAVRAALDLLPTLPGDCYLAINISAGAACSGRLVEMLDGDDAARVVLELTEHDAVDDYPSLRHHLRATGARVAVDDAGAGFASLAHVLNLDPEIIKLDRDLTSSIDGDETRRALASSLVAFGNEVDAIIVAEGVETEAEAGCLLDLGIHLGQGYLFGRPGPLATSGSGS